MRFPGEDSQSRADTLATELRKKLNTGEVKVTRPIKIAELRMSSLDDITNSQGVVRAMAQSGDAAPGRYKSTTLNGREVDSIP